MMKRLWQKYSYTIILVVLSVAVLFVFSAALQIEKNEKYVTVTVEQGDTLWAISQQYNREHRLSFEQFIDWVEKENGILNGEIYAGDHILIPVEKERILQSVYASE